MRSMRASILISHGLPNRSERTNLRRFYLASATNFKAAIGAKALIEHEVVDQEPTYFLLAREIAHGRAKAVDLIEMAENITPVLARFTSYIQPSGSRTSCVAFIAHRAYTLHFYTRVHVAVPRSAWGTADVATNPRRLFK